VASPRVNAVERLDARLGVLLAAGRLDEAEELVREARADGAADPLVREWGARQALERGRDRQARASAAAGGPSANEHAGAALAWFESAREDYAALAAQPGDSLIGRIGLAAALMKLVPYRAAEADALLAEAAGHARRAVELDRWYWQAHYNLGAALHLRAYHAAGGEAGIAHATWREVAAALQGAVQVNGLQASALNDGAHALVMQHRLQPDAEALATARAYARRALALSQSVAAGACLPSFGERRTTSACWDTLSEVQELEGDLPGALESARSALEALDAGDASRRAVRAARLERLEGALAGGG
jgi:hypothetical protein